MRVRAARPDVPVAGLGVGSPGPLDAAAGVVHHAPTLAGWRDVPLRDLLAARLGLEVCLENDANVATLAEWRFGAGRGLADVVYVTVSTGIGGGVVADGRLLSGRRGLAAEVGHMAITDRPVPCGCGGTGCLGGPGLRPVARPPRRRGGRRRAREQPRAPARRAPAHGARRGHRGDRGRRARPPADA